MPESILTLPPVGVSDVGAAVWLATGAAVAAGADVVGAGGYSTGFCTYWLHGIQPVAVKIRFPIGDEAMVPIPVLGSTAGGCTVLILK